MAPVREDEVDQVPCLRPAAERSPLRSGDLARHVVGEELGEFFRVVANPEDPLETVRHLMQGTAPRCAVGDDDNVEVAADVVEDLGGGGCGFAADPDDASVTAEQDAVEFDVVGDEAETLSNDVVRECL